MKSAKAGEIWKAQDINKRGFVAGREARGDVGKEKFFAEKGWHLTYLADAPSKELGAAG